MIRLGPMLPRIVACWLALGCAREVAAQVDLRWINEAHEAETIRLDNLPLTAEERLPLPFDERDFPGVESVRQRDFAADVLADYRNYYSADTFLPLLAGLGVGAAIANTHADSGIRDFYQDNIRNTSTDEWSELLHTPTVLGNGYLVLPLFATAALSGHWAEEGTAPRQMGEWGERSLRTFLVGAPPMFALQYLTGGSRPDETGHASSWVPLQDSNGVSGHSFMGAIPFLTAAQMTDDPWLRAGLYAGSTLAGLSRINDDAHFTSQVLIGWWTAFLASEAVRMTSDGDRTWRIVPIPQRDGMMVALEIVR